MDDQIDSHRLDAIYALYARPNIPDAQVADSMTYGLWAFAEVRPKARAAKMVREYMERRKWTGNTNK